MTNVVIFGGTTEGRLLCEICADAVKKRAPGAGYGAFRVVYCVATRDGARAVDSLPGVDVRIGRLGADEMAALLNEVAPALVVDATHPYAAEVSANIETACRCAAVPCLLRVARASGAQQIRAEQGGDTDCTYFDGMTGLLAWLEREPGNIFVTMGSSAAAAFAALPDCRSRVWLRVLPNMESLRACLELGYRSDKLICMQGPFSEDLNRAMFKAANADILVTKESGAAGGFPEKLRAARGLGMRVAVLSRPNESAALTAPSAQAVSVTFEEAREHLLALTINSNT